MSEREGDEMGRRKTYPGLRSHRGRDGRLYYYTDTRIGGHGEQGRRIYARHGALEFEEAVRLHKELTETEWRWKHGLGSPEPEKDRPALTFKQAGKLWLKALESAGRDPKTIDNYEHYLSLVGHYVGGKSLDEISLEDLEHVRVEMKRTGRAFRTRRNIESIASSLFAFAMHPTRGWVTQNPFQGLVTEKAPKERTRRGEIFLHLHPREDARLLDACADAWHKCAVAIGLYLGVRETPVASLRLVDINLFGGAICVPCEFNKGHNRGVREDLWLPIPRHLMPYLKAQHEQATMLSSPWLFPSGHVRGRVSATGHIYPGKLRELVARVAKKVGYEGANFHALRAICNNRFRAAGISDALGQVARGARGVLGHASEQTAAPYLVASVEYLRPIIDSYDRWLDEKAAVKVADITRGAQSQK